MAPQKKAARSWKSRGTRESLWAASSRGCPGIRPRRSRRALCRAFARPRFADDVEIESKGEAMELYQALFEADHEAGGYVVTFPDFGYGVTQGETFEEAMEMAQDLLMLTISGYQRRSEPLPVPRRRKGAKYQAVRLPFLQAAKVELYNAFVASGLKKAEFARRAGIPKTHVERLFSLRHQSRFDQIEGAFRALGKSLRLDVQDAAWRYKASCGDRAASRWRRRSRRSSITHARFTCDLKIHRRVAWRAGALGK